MRRWHTMAITAGMISAFAVAIQVPAYAGTHHGGQEETPVLHDGEEHGGDLNVRSLPPELWTTIMRPMGLPEIANLDGVSRGFHNSVSSMRSLNTAASFTGSGSIAIDASNNVYVAAEHENRIYKINVDTREVTVLAGTGTAGFNGDGMPANIAQLHFPTGITVDLIGNVFIADAGNHRIRRIDAITGLITTVAGDGTKGFGGDGGPASKARIRDPQGIAVDEVGNLFIADMGNFRVRKVDVINQKISTVAGNGRAGFNSDENLPAINTRLVSPTHMALDKDSNLFIVDQIDGRVRKVDAKTKILTTVAGDGALGKDADNILATRAILKFPSGMTVDAHGNLYIAETGADRIRRVDTKTGLITTIVGTGTPGVSKDGEPPFGSPITTPAGIAMTSNGWLYLTEGLVKSGQASQSVRYFRLKGSN